MGKLIFLNPYSHLASFPIIFFKYPLFFSSVAFVRVVEKQQIFAFDVLCLIISIGAGRDTR